MQNIITFIKARITSLTNANSSKTYNLEIADYTALLAATNNSTHFNNVLQHVCTEVYEELASEGLV